MVLGADTDHLPTFTLLKLGETVFWGQGKHGEVNKVVHEWKNLWV